MVHKFFNQTGNTVNGIKASFEQTLLSNTYIEENVARLVLFALL